jgi:Ca2+-binding RTX toxin-like protein
VTLRSRCSSIAGAGVLVGCALAASSGTARAAWTSCTWAAGAVTASGDASSANVLSVGPTGEILANGVACGAADVHNTDLVRVVNTSPGSTLGVTIDLSGGAFAPGATDEPGSTSDEIEFDLSFSGVILPEVTVVGGAGPDHIVAGSAGLNLNAGEVDDDVDVTYLVSGSDLGNSILDRLVGNGNDDILSNAGGEGTGGPWPFSTPLIDGGPGNDILRSGTEDALLVGGPDNDQLFGGPDDLDSLQGDAGNDELHGGAGGDILSGGVGFDILSGDAGNDQLDGGNDLDWAEYIDAPGPVTATLPGGTAAGADGYGSTDTYTAIERLGGSPQADLLTGDGGNNIVNGRGGDDTIVLGAGNDVSRGGDGADTISGEAGNDGISGDAGSDNLIGGGQDDAISDGPGNDLVSGGPGDDELDASGFDPDLGLLPSGADRLSGGAGTDRVHYWPRVTAVSVILDGLADDGAVGEGDNVGGPADDVENVDGGFGNDLLIGNGGRNAVDGQAGRDLILGLDGPDLITGGADADVLTGGAGNDRFDAEDDVVDVVTGGTGVDQAAVDRLVDGDPVRDLTLLVEVLT